MKCVHPLLDNLLSQSQALLLILQTRPYFHKQLTASIYRIEMMPGSYYFSSLDRYFTKKKTGEKKEWTTAQAMKYIWSCDVFFLDH